MQPALPCNAKWLQLACLSAGCTKWQGLQRYLKAADLTAKNVLAIGDGLNDFDMLKNAGVSVAMANAKEAVIEVADHITTDNDHDGVAKALLRFVKREDAGSQVLKPDNQLWGDPGDDEQSDDEDDESEWESDDEAGWLWK